MAVRLAPEVAPPQGDKPPRQIGKQASIAAIALLLILRLRPLTLVG